LTLLLACHTCHMSLPPSPRPAAAAGPIAPLSIDLEFKKPTLLPNKLTLSGDSKAFAKDAAAGKHPQLCSAIYALPALGPKHAAVSCASGLFVECEQHAAQLYRQCTTVLLLKKLKAAGFTVPQSSCCVKAFGLDEIIATVCVFVLQQARRIKRSNSVIKQASIVL
jgi:hypothetical protein